MVLAVDPGPEHCGVVLYDTEGKHVDLGQKDMPVEGVLSAITVWAAGLDLVAIERVQSYGIAGSSLLKTSEVVGRLQQAAILAGLPVRLVYRREVLRALDVSGKGTKDALVRQRLIEIFGGTKKAAVGTKKERGPCYGVAGHAWAALAVALTALEGA